MKALESHNNLDQAEDADSPQHLRRRNSENSEADHNNVRLPLPPELAASCPSEIICFQIRESLARGGNPQCTAANCHCEDSQETLEEYARALHHLIEARKKMCQHTITNCLEGDVGRVLFTWLELGSNNPFLPVNNRAGGPGPFNGAQPEGDVNFACMYLNNAVFENNEEHGVDNENGTADVHRRITDSTNNNRGSCSPVLEQQLAHGQHQEGFDENENDTTTSTDSPSSDSPVTPNNERALLDTPKRSVLSTMNENEVPELEGNAGIFPSSSSAGLINEFLTPSEKRISSSSVVPVPLSTSPQLSILSETSTVRCEENEEVIDAVGTTPNHADTNTHDCDSARKFNFEQQIQNYLRDRIASSNFKNRAKLMLQRISASLDNGQSNPYTQGASVTVSAEIDQRDGKMLEAAKGKNKDKVSTESFEATTTRTKRGGPRKDKPGPKSAKERAAKRHAALNKSEISNFEKDVVTSSSINITLEPASSSSSQDNSSSGIVSVENVKKRPKKDVTLGEDQEENRRTTATTVQANKNEKSDPPEKGPCKDAGSEKTIRESSLAAEKVTNKKTKREMIQEILEKQQQEQEQALDSLSSPMKSPPQVEQEPTSTPTPGLQLLGVYDDDTASVSSELPILEWQKQKKLKQTKENDNREKNCTSTSHLKENEVDVKDAVNFFKNLQNEKAKLELKLSMQKENSNASKSVENDDEDEIQILEEIPKNQRSEDSIHISFNKNGKNSLSKKSVSTPVTSDTKKCLTSSNKAPLSKSCSLPGPSPSSVSISISSSSSSKNKQKDRPSRTSGSNFSELSDQPKAEIPVAIPETSKGLPVKSSSSDLEPPPVPPLSLLSPILSLSANKIPKRKEAPPPPTISIPPKQRQAPPPPVISGQNRQSGVSWKATFQRRQSNDDKSIRQSSSTKKSDRTANTRRGRSRSRTPPAPRSKPRNRSRSRTPPAPRSTTENRKNQNSDSSAPETYPPHIPDYDPRDNAFKPPQKAVPKVTKESLLSVLQKNSQKYNASNSRQEASGNTNRGLNDKMSKTSMDRDEVPRAQEKETIDLTSPSGPDLKKREDCTDKNITQSTKPAAMSSSSNSNIPKRAGEEIVNKQASEANENQRKGISFSIGKNTAANQSHGLKNSGPAAPNPQQGKSKSKIQLDPATGNFIMVPNLDNLEPRGSSTVSGPKNWGQKHTNSSGTMTVNKGSQIVIPASRDIPVELEFVNKTNRNNVTERSERSGSMDAGVVAENQTSASDNGTESRGNEPSTSASGPTHLPDPRLKNRNMLAAEQKRNASPTVMTDETVNSTTSSSTNGTWVRGRPRSPISEIDAEENKGGDRTRSNSPDTNQRTLDNRKRSNTSPHGDRNKKKFRGKGNHFRGGGGGRGGYRGCGRGGPGPYPNHFPGNQFGRGGGGGERGNSRGERISRLTSQGRYNQPPRGEDLNQFTPDYFPGTYEESYFPRNVPQYRNPHYPNYPPQFVPPPLMGMEFLNPNVMQIPPQHNPYFN